MKVRILQSCLASGSHQEAGTVVDLPDPVALSLVRTGRAALTNASATPEDIETRTPAVEVRDPKPSRKKSEKA